MGQQVKRCGDGFLQQVDDDPHDDAADAEVRIGQRAADRQVDVDHAVTVFQQVDRQQDRQAGGIRAVHLVAKGQLVEEQAVFCLELLLGHAVVHVERHLALGDRVAGVLGGVGGQGRQVHPFYRGGQVQRHRRHQRVDAALYHKRRIAVDPAFQVDFGCLAGLAAQPADFAAQAGDVGPQVRPDKIVGPVDAALLQADVANAQVQRHRRGGGCCRQDRRCRRGIGRRTGRSGHVVAQFANVELGILVQDCLHKKLLPVDLADMQLVGAGLPVKVDAVEAQLFPARQFGTGIDFVTDAHVAQGCLSAISQAGLSGVAPADGQLPARIQSGTGDVDADVRSRRHQQRHKVNAAGIQLQLERALRQVQLPPGIDASLTVDAGFQVQRHGGRPDAVKAAQAGGQLAQVQFYRPAFTHAAPVQLPLFNLGLANLDAPVRRFLAARGRSPRRRIPDPAGEVVLLAQAAQVDVRLVDAQGFQRQAAGLAVQPDASGFDHVCLDGRPGAARLVQCQLAQRQLSFLYGIAQSILRGTKGQLPAAAQAQRCRTQAGVGGQQRVEIRTPARHVECIDLVIAGQRAPGRIDLGTERGTFRIGTADAQACRNRGLHALVQPGQIQRNVVELAGKGPGQGRIAHEEFAPAQTNGVNGPLPARCAAGRRFFVARTVWRHQFEPVEAVVCCADQVETRGCNADFADLEFAAERPEAADVECNALGAGQRLAVGILQGQPAQADDAADIQGRNAFGGRAVGNPQPGVEPDRRNLHGQADGQVGKHRCQIHAVKIEVHHRLAISTEDMAVAGQRNGFAVDAGAEFWLGADVQISREIGHVRNGQLQPVDGVLVIERPVVQHDAAVADSGVGQREQDRLSGRCLEALDQVADVEAVVGKAHQPDVRCVQLQAGNAPVSQERARAEMYFQPVQAGEGRTAVRLADLHIADRHAEGEHIECQPADADRPPKGFGKLFFRHPAQQQGSGQVNGDPQTRQGQCGYDSDMKGFAKAGGEFHGWLWHTIRIARIYSQCFQHVGWRRSRHYAEDWPAPLPAGPGCDSGAEDTVAESPGESWTLRCFAGVAATGRLLPAFLADHACVGSSAAGRGANT